LLSIRYALDAYALLSCQPEEDILEIMGYLGEDEPSSPKTSTISCGSGSG
jgi:hypothetical protein